ncbi:arylmalonate decarboxylase [Streptomyces radicis]|uniref:Arylmalonate decarboxylase n=2 Tax=Streptomyces radicis TaxID=1750517 RepID=A0A3A9WKI4_9ACTN|nr:arylmalonate decarboxylase [Streptomyces radicis]RKN27432.1 arylmalonate decarboxylase [Streptomyces radicis]
MAPPGVRFLTTRMPFARTGVVDDLRLVDDLEAHASLLADAEVELIAFNCTAASMLAGSEHITRRIHAATGLPAVTTIDAVVEGLRALGARTIALLDPYPWEVERREIDYLRRHGFDVVAHGGPECHSPVEQGSIPPERWPAEARTLVGPGSDADALLISCAGTQVAAVLDELERTVHRPVVASNQALVWKVLRTLGISHDLPRYGRLLSAAHSLPGPGLRPATPRTGGESPS